MIKRNKPSDTEQPVVGSTGKIAGRQFCADCHSDNPNIKYNHWLDFSTEGHLWAHAQQSWGWKPGAVDDIVRSYNEVRRHWSEQAERMADADTGAPLHWRQARDQVYRKQREEKVQRAKIRGESIEQSDTFVDVARLLVEFIGNASAISPWSAAHMYMICHGIGAPRRWKDAVVFCERMAEEYPDDARAWRAEARDYRQSYSQQSTVDDGIPF